MAKKKAARKKKAVRKKKAALRRKPVRANRTKRATKASRAKKPVRRRKPVREISSGSERSSLGSGTFETAAPPLRRGLGENAAGQSGDLQGLSRAEDVDSESVEELIEEGQSFEADVVSGVENAPDADEGEVRTHERPEDDLIDEGEQ